MKFTKTEADLLDRAAHSPRQTVSVEWGYQAGRRYGRRQINAAIKLVQAGRLVKVDGDQTPLYKPGYGINGRAILSVFKLVTK